MTGKTIGNPGVLIQMMAYRKTEEDIQKKQEKNRKRYAESAEIRIYRREQKKDE